MKVKKSKFEKEIKNHEEKLAGVIEKKLKFIQIFEEANNKCN